MNEFSYTIKKFIRGYKAYLRLASDAEPKAILEKGGEDKYFPTRCDALAAIADNLCRYVNGNLVRDGEICSNDVRNSADALFPDLRKSVGTRRPFEVAYKKRRKP